MPWLRAMLTWYLATRLWHVSAESLEELAPPPRSGNFLAGSSEASGNVLAADEDDQEEVAMEPAPAPVPAPVPAAAPGPAQQVVFTTLSSAAFAGATVLNVESSEGFKVGDHVMIGEPDVLRDIPAETRTIIGFGSLILDAALQKTYPASTLVRRVDEIPPPPDRQKVNLTVYPPESTRELISETNQFVDAERDVINPDDPESQLKEELAAITWLLDDLQEMNDGLSEDAYRAKIATAQAELAKEATPGTAQMLGDMRREMHQLAAPFFGKVLRENMEELKQRQKEILAELEGKQPPKRNKAADAADDEGDEPEEQLGVEEEGDGLEALDEAIPEVEVKHEHHINWMAMHLVFFSIGLLVFLGIIAVFFAVRMWMRGELPPPRLL
eukprot:TRINITY_DN121596_c0_g1_i1.p1 TRINITY_DN121596_c0_g1~~TRINITY_DN121596_c0_g1_i1.p1  ORF type:complete len:385 (-),score=101.91 TRINITY_DN121596_c0_g1_i1:189-1343(-)